MKPRYIIGGLIAVACMTLSFWLLSQSGVQYADISTATDLKKRVSIKGKWIREEACNYDSQANLFTFVMQDDNAKKVKVIFAGSKPNNFELAESVVVKGKMENGTFMASDILTKCPSKYEGSNEMKEHPGEVKKSL